MASSNSSATDCPRGTNTIGNAGRFPSGIGPSGDLGVLGIDEDVFLLTENDHLEGVTGDGKMGDGEFAVAVLDGGRGPCLVP